jgi:RNA-directed DNA polymerase
MHIKEAISNDIQIPISLIDEALSVARSQVKKFNINKRNGKPRAILQPSKKLKTLQYWLLANLFKKLPVHKSAVAYLDGVSILHNAKRHSEHRYFLKMDLIDFFPSIKYADVLPLIESWHERTSPIWNLDDEAKNLIRLSCFFKEDILPIGYPSSPVLSNVVMYDFDAEITRLISDRVKYGECVYTRYADDLVFSTDKKDVCIDLLKNVTAFIESTTSPKISVNKSKTKLGTSTGGSASVTGLKVCSDGHITIHRKQKDHIRLLLSLYRKGMLKDEEHDSLLGHLAYCHYVAPAFYSNLLKKYFIEIRDLRKKMTGQ